MESTAGHYYQKQIACKDRVIAWSHGSRFTKALQIIGPGPFDKLLDYGCGDGTLLAMISDRVHEGWGGEIYENQIEDCRTRLGMQQNLHFCHTQELRTDRFQHAFDVVVCMETLEHCLEDVADQVINDLAYLCHPSGRVIISVPIETGPTFLMKQSLRSMAAWRGLSDYRYYLKYSFWNALRMIFATESTSIHRPVLGPPGAEHYQHYGFNWKLLRKRIHRVLDVRRTTYSPLGFLGGWTSSQVWFICQPRVTRES